MGKRFTEKEKKIIRYEMRHLDTILLSIFGFVGLILVWRGISPLLEQLEKAYLIPPLVFLFFGFVIIFLTGAMIRR